MNLSLIFYSFSERTIYDLELFLSSLRPSQASVPRVSIFASRDLLPVLSRRGKQLVGHYEHSILWYRYESLHSLQFVDRHTDHHATNDENIGVYL